MLAEYAYKPVLIVFAAGSTIDIAWCSIDFSGLQYLVHQLTCDGTL